MNTEIINRKNILILLPEPPRSLRDSGISIRYIPLLESLYDNCVIDAIVIGKQLQKEGDLSCLQKYCRNVNVVTHMNKNKISLIQKMFTRLRFIYPWSLPRSWIVYGHIHIAEQLKNITNGQSYDTLVCVSGYNYPYVKLVDTKRIIVDFIDSPTVLSWRNVIGSKRSYFIRLYESLKTFIWESRIIRNSDASLYISSYDVNIIPSLFATREKRHVIRNGYSANDYTSTTIDTIEKPSIGFLGNMGYFPNEEAVIWFHDNVFNRLKDIIPNLTFYIIGRSPTDNVKRLAATPGIVVTGEVDSIWRHLNSMDIMVFPLQRGAGVKNKILESMYANRLTITTKIGDEGIDAAHEGAMIICRTADEYVDMIVKYLNSVEQRNMIANNGREFVIHNFSWHLIQEKFRKLILE